MNKRMINSSGYITLSAIADSLFVSRATIINDLDGTKEYIKKGKLEVISHPNKGLRIEGKESDKRQFLMKIVTTKDGKNSNDMVTKQISIQAGNRIVIQKIITEQEHVHNSYLMAQDIIRYVAQYCDIQTTEDEAEYLSELLARSRYNTRSSVRNGMQ